MSPSSLEGLAHADGPETLGPQGTASVKSVARLLAWAALSLGMMFLFAGLAWSIRGGMEPPSSEPQPDLETRTRASLVPPPDSSLVQFKRGRLAYQVHCARCHGPEGRGDGPDAVALRPPPRDLASRPRAHGETPEAIRSVILQGIPGTAMTGWSQLLSSQELDAVVDYVRSLGPPPRETEASESQKALLRGAGFEPIEPAIAASPLTFETLDGRKRTLDQDQGKAILLVFWGTTCAPCMDELPSLDQLAREFATAKLAVLPICVDEPDAALVREVARTRTKHLPLFVDQTGLARIQYDVQTLPCAVLIDPEGRQIGRAQGGKDWSTEAVHNLLRTLASQADHLKE
ncbi:Thiol-disulfide isomerase or thioredoxin [Singulisphaera sp. GP187]|uniref:redoxin domain-containing protein n=1 Tax=Singulisphaera sp. GP187 TaxID=1882752 RepID=UPI000927D106|nr:redoxin domain-containing protein [Singulisphaera sp. GP187]SIO19464.1 Thiol-disulfide isomerase or thioredoxin [Singulisphaera sp. GP187]